MARAEFLEALKDLGFEFDLIDEARIAIKYTIDMGSFADREIRLGLETGDDFPVNPPAGGIHVTPRLLEQHPGGEPPLGGINDSPFGAEWQYWSRPFQNWPSTDRSARTYMAFVRQLFSLV